MSLNLSMNITDTLCKNSAEKLIISRAVAHLSLIRFSHDTDYNPSIKTQHEPKLNHLQTVT